jgi:diguanylate cyclase (GGDEF)-like protein
MRKIIEKSKFTVRGKDRRRKHGVGRGAKKTTSVTVSIGVASSSADKAPPTDILRIADQALYKAKERGRNCVVTARPGKGAVAVERSMRILSVS